MSVQSISWAYSAPFPTPATPVGIGLSMAKSSKRKARPGRPRTTGPGQQVAVRCHPDFLARVDKWRAKQDVPEGKLSRPQAIRRLAELALRTAGI